MTKLYYTDPLKAAIMARDFGVKFQADYMGSLADVDYLGGELEIVWKDSVEVSCDLGIFGFTEFGMIPDDKLHIHPDSYDIFKPKHDDLIQMGDDVLWVTSDDEFFAKNFELLRHNFINLRRIEELQGEDIEIIQRNNIAFYMPETETKE